MRKSVSVVGLTTFVIAAAASLNAQAISFSDCDNANIVGGVGSGGGFTPSDLDAGWLVGNGQCNGDFTVVSDTGFPDNGGGDGIELGLRAEQRSFGQILPPDHIGNDYEVMTGSDTTQPNPGRAWWNFQQSMAYDGDLSTLDALVFRIRTDAGTSVPAAPVFDFLVFGPTLDDRRSRSRPTSNSVFDDFYQTSQNPVFGWFSSYDMNEEGAWYLTLAAQKDDSLVDVSICIHTPNAACNAEPIVYTCGAFKAPIPADGSIALKKKQNRVLPLKMVCTDSNGNVLTDADISPPVVQVAFDDGANPPVDASGDILEAGKGTDGNEFVSTDGMWSFNLQTKPHSASGTYTVSVVGAGGDLLVGSPTAMFTRP